MKQKIFLAVLIVEAVLCAVLAFAVPSGVMTGGLSLFTFPFAQIGDGLRALSLSGKAGNVVAIILYILFCGSPILALLAISRKRKVYPEDGLLAGLGTLLFFVMYMMVNPGMIPDVLGSFVGLAGTGKTTLGVMLYSVIFGYVILRSLRRIGQAEMDTLLGYVRIMLYILGVFFVWAVFGAGIRGLQAEFAALEAGNTASGADDLLTQILGAGVGASRDQLTLSKGFLVIRYLVDVLPYLLDTAIVFGGLALLDALKEDRYGERAVLLAQKLSCRCGKYLAVVVISNMVFNVLQLIFLEKLLVIDGTVQIPILSIFFVMIVLFLTKLLTENKALKEDNDLFV